MNGPLRGNGIAAVTTVALRVGQLVTTESDAS